MLIEKLGKSTIRSKTRCDRSNPLPSQVSLRATAHLGLVNEVSVPASKNYNCT
jgi:hypothetical protein